MDNIISAAMGLIVILIVLIILGSCIKVVPQSRAFVVERLGAFRTVWGVGLHIKVPLFERVAKNVSLKEQVVDFPPQPVITKDNVTMQIDTVIYFQITDPKLYAYGVENPMSAIENLTATTLRNIIGDLELDKYLTSRDHINGQMRAILDEATDNWGIKVNRVELKNIMPPRDIQESMEKQMRAERERREAILQAEGQKQSQILVAEGEKDSPIVRAEAAKEAGKIVILDDNFKSIKDAIWYGRTIYHNILKFCRFQLVINVAAVVVSAIAPFFGVEEPLKVTHLLFVNLVMDGLGAIMLGNEPAQERYMSEPPRRRDESIVSKSMMAQIVTMGLWLTALSFVFLKVPFFDSFFASTEQKLSAYFVLFIWSALFNAFNVRSDSFDIFKDLKLNPGFMRVFVIIVLVQAFIVNAALIPVPVFGWISNMFSCVPFPPAGWAAAILLAFTMIPVDILRKVIVGRK